MTPQTDIIRRRADGSIDTDFYARRAAAMRNAARRDVPASWLRAMKSLPARARRALESILLFPAGKA